MSPADLATRRLFDTSDNLWKPREPRNSAQAPLTRIGDIGESARHLLNERTVVYETPVR